MDRKAITIPVEIDARTFRDFALFDTLRRQKRWRAPVVFAAIMLAFAAVCFSMTGKAEQAALLGTVLAAVGLVLPGAYFLNFFLSVRAQCKRLGLGKPKAAYKLVIDAADGVDVSNGRERTSFRWAALYAAYRVKGCVYLYVAHNRAYLLPDGQGTSDPETLWTLLKEKMPAGKCFDRR